MDVIDFSQVIIITYTCTIVYNWRDYLSRLPSPDKSGREFNGYQRRPAKFRPLGTPITGCENRDKTHDIIITVLYSSYSSVLLETYNTFQSLYQQSFHHVDSSFVSNSCPFSFSCFKLCIFGECVCPYPAGSIQVQICPFISASEIVIRGLNGDFRLRCYFDTVELIELDPRDSIS